MAESDEETLAKMERHNAIARKLLDEIILPMAEEGATNVELAYLTESVAVGVLAFCIKRGLTRGAIATFCTHVAKRLNEEAMRDYLAEAPPEGTA